MTARGGILDFGGFDYVGWAEDDGAYELIEGDNQKHRPLREGFKAIETKKASGAETVVKDSLSSTSRTTSQDEAYLLVSYIRYAKKLEFSGLARYTILS